VIAEAIGAHGIDHVGQAIQRVESVSQSHGRVNDIREVADGVVLKPGLTIERVEAVGDPVAGIVELDAFVMSARVARLTYIIQNLLREVGAKGYHITIGGIQMNC
jgi:hypothetical protein